MRPRPSLHEQEAKSILRKYKRIDSWFVTRYGMNLYRGCFHDCVYCDGRAEKYQVEGEFGRDIEVKTNALEVLRRELDPARRRKPLEASYTMIGSGVTDAYQPAERHYRLTRRAIELFLEFRRPAFILTKSPFILEDMDRIEELHTQCGVIVGCSFSSVDAKISRVFEPTVASPQKRLDVLARFADRGIPCAMFLMPIIPFVTDGVDKIEEALAAAKRVGARYVLAGGMTLKPGRQMDHFMHVLASYDDSLVPAYYRAFGAMNPWGGASYEYDNALHGAFYEAAKRVRVPIRMPKDLFSPIVSERDKVVIMLEHIDYVLKLKKAETHYAKAAHSIAFLDGSIREALPTLTKLRGVGPVTQRIVAEILDTGTSRLYETLVGEFAS